LNSNEAQFSSPAEGPVRFSEKFCDMYLYITEYSLQTHRAFCWWRKFCDIYINIYHRIFLTNAPGPLLVTKILWYINIYHRIFFKNAPGAIETSDSSRRDDY